MTEHTDVEKAAEEWARSYAYMMPNTNPCKERVLAAQEEGFLAGAAWAAPKWIRVSERLPEEERDVVLYGSRGIFFGWRSSTESGSPKFYNFDSEIYGVTHWMPLPAAPKEEK